MKLSKSEKKVAAKVLYKNGWTSRLIGEWLGISKDTVIRSTDKPTSEELRQFETEFEAAIKGVKFEIRTRIYKRMLELIPKEKRLDMLVKVAELLDGKTTSQDNSQKPYDFANLGRDFERARIERGLPLDG